jgi:undecaprenyl phosphate-alpha-L-ara4N flippase subunit ArnE
MRRFMMQGLGVFILLVLIWTAVQVLLKIGLSRLSGSAVNLHFFLQALSSWAILAALFLAVVGSLIWFVVLTRFDLSYSNLMLSLTFVLVLLASAVFFGEHISLLRWIGAALIVLGVFFVSQSR